MTKTRNYRSTEEQTLYWTDVFRRLKLESQGVQLELFLNDPWHFLRKIGVGSLTTDMDIQIFLPAKGSA